MKFKITAIDAAESVNTYACIFSNEIDEVDINITIGQPEIDSSNDVLNIINATCLSVFGGDGGVKHATFDEISIDTWVNCV